MNDFEFNNINFYLGQTRDQIRQLIHAKLCELIFNAVRNCNTPAIDVATDIVNSLVINRLIYFVD